MNIEKINMCIKNIVSKKYITKSYNYIPKETCHSNKLDYFSLKLIFLKEHIY